METLEPKGPKYDVQKRPSLLASRDSKAVDIHKVYSQGINLILGSVSFNIFDHTGRMRDKSTALNVWPFYGHDPQLGCMKEYEGVSSKIFQAKDKKRDQCHCKLYLEMQSFVSPVEYSLKTLSKINIDFNLTRSDSRTRTSINVMNKDQRQVNTLSSSRLSPSEVLLLRTLVVKDPITELNENEKKIIFKGRQKASKVSKALPIFLRSLNWVNPYQVAEAYKLLNQWKPMDPELAIYLLGDKFADKVVRDYAVGIVSQLSEQKFHFYTPQLTQALVYEDYHSSSLCDLLLKRALECPYSIGHAFFWYMKSNLHVIITYERYSLIIEQFCMM